MTTKTKDMQTFKTLGFKPGDKIRLIGPALGDNTTLKATCDLYRLDLGETATLSGDGGGTPYLKHKGMDFGRRGNHGTWELVNRPTQKKDSHEISINLVLKVNGVEVDLQAIKRILENVSKL